MCNRKHSESSDEHSFFARSEDDFLRFAVVRRCFKVVELFEFTDEDSVGLVVVIVYDAGAEVSVGVTVPVDPYVPYVVVELVAAGVRLSGYVAVVDSDRVLSSIAKLFAENNKTTAAHAIIFL